MACDSCHDSARAPLITRGTLAPVSRRTRNLYAWKERTPDGRKRQIEAQLFGSKWKISSIHDDEEEWTVHAPPLLDDLIELEKKVFNKYQRKHNAWDQVLGVRKLIEAQLEPGDAKPWED